MTRAKAIGYARVSTDRQVEEGLGLEVQERAIRAQARQRGLRLLEIIRDEGLSGAVEDRPGLGQLLQQLDDGMVVLVMRLDRLAREQVTQEILIRDMRRCGASLISCSDAEDGYLEDDPSDPARKMIRQMLGSVAEYEKALILLRLRTGRAAKAAKGGYAYGSPGYGTRSEGGRLVADDGETDAVRLARRLRARGASYREICRALDEAGHRPRRSDTWHPQVVARILSRRPGA